MANDSINDLTRQVQQLLEDAYQRGYRTGSEDMRNSILAAVQAPRSTDAGNAGSSVAQAPAQEEERSVEKSRKAPRGLAMKVIGQILADSPGLALPELEEAVRTADDRIAMKSVYNHLRANEGELYRREGQRWFLISSNPDGQQGWVGVGRTPPAQAGTGGWTPPAPSQPSSGSAEPVSSGSKGAWGT
jgi:hypothetical protein